MTERRSLVWLAAGLVVAALRWIVEWPTADEIFHSLADEVLLFALALRWADPGLFPGDTWLDLAEQVFAPAYSLLVAPIVAAADSPARAGWAISIASGALFFTGLWALFRQLARHPVAFVACALLAATPLFEDAAVGPRDALPRDLLFGLLPWLLAALWSPTCRAPLRAGLLGLGLGVAANVHPLTGLHYALLAALLLGGEPGAVPERIRRVASLAVGTALGALPFVLRFLAYPRSGRPDPAVMELRVPGLVAPSLAASFETWLPIVALAVVTLAAWRRSPERRRLAVALTVVVAVGVLGERMGSVAPQLGQLQLGRFSRVGAFVALVSTAALIDRAWGDRTRAIRALACVLVALALTGSLWRPLMHRAARSVLGRTPPPPGLAPSRARAGDLTGRSVDERRAYVALTRWCREHLPVGARVIVPPEDYSHFRTMARRSVTACRKDGGFAVTFLGERGGEWLDEYRMAVDVYRDSEPGAFEAWAHRDSATHVLIDDPGTALPFVVAARFGRFSLYELPARH